MVPKQKTENTTANRLSEVVKMSNMHVQSAAGKYCWTLDTLIVYKLQIFRQKTVKVVVIFVCKDLYIKIFSCWIEILNLNFCVFYDDCHFHIQQENILICFPYNKPAAAFTDCSGLHVVIRLHVALGQLHEVPASTEVLQLYLSSDGLVWAFPWGWLHHQEENAIDKTHSSLISGMMYTIIFIRNYKNLIKLASNASPNWDSWCITIWSK